MKLACNYYPETEELVNQGKIDIDYFKFPALVYQMGILESCNKDEFEEFTSRVTKIKPILFHGLFPTPHDLSSPTLINNFDFDTVNRLIELTKTPGISFHPSLVPIDNSIPINDTLNNIINNINFIKQHYSNLDFISVENLDSLRYGELINPKIISQIINEAGCDFLLDISHAFCSSLCKGEDFHDYLYKLPLDKVYEIHINGWILKDRAIMCHTKINETGYDILKELLGYCNPKIITIEYGRNNDKLGVGIPLLTPGKINIDVENEIIEQVNKIKQIIN